MKNRIYRCLLSLLLLILSGAGYSTPVDDHKTLEIGADAPNFSLPGVDGKTYTLSSFKNANILVIIFTCNHCPTAQAYEDRMIKLTNDYKAKGVQVVAISPNDPKAVTLSELGYTDMADSFEEMKIRSKTMKYNFPYLYDGKTQGVAKAYGPIATPHVFIFDKERKLRYSGRIDDTEKPSKTPSNLDTRKAIDELLLNQPVSTTTTKVFGCSIKWAEKEDNQKKEAAAWAKEPVKLADINETEFADLMKNTSDKLRLIIIWAATNPSSAKVYPDLMTMNRMYRKRDFEFISINADGAAQKEKALQFLQKQQASNTNYIFTGSNKTSFIRSIDPKWNGILPYTLLVEPGGKIVYAKQGTINPADWKKTIVENPLIGRYY
jgi:glutathione peroxidase-family protein